MARRRALPRNYPWRSLGGLRTLPDFRTVGCIRGDWRLGRAVGVDHHSGNRTWEIREMTACTERRESLRSPATSFMRSHLYRKLSRWGIREKRMGGGAC